MAGAATATAAATTTAAATAAATRGSVHFAFLAFLPKVPALAEST
jgi:hypothetical protein